LTRIEPDSAVDCQWLRARTASAESQPLRSSSTVVSSRVRPPRFDVLRRLCTGDPPSRLHALHSRVSGLVREANSGADAVIGAPWVLLADGDSLARETLLDLSAEESAAW
jgi:hypothetical protein